MANTEENWNIIQEELDDLDDCSKRSKMKFNSTKCKVMHSGTNNENFCYKLGAHQLEIVQEEKDLGLISQSHDDYHYLCEVAMKRKV